MRKAGDILSAIFNERFDPGFLEKAKTMSGLFSSWEAVTTEAGISAAAAHSRVAEHERGIVLVEADHPGWVQILQTKQSRLLEIFQIRYGKELEIRGIGFRLSRGPIDTAQRSEAPQAEPEETPTEAAGREKAETVQAVTDTTVETDESFEEIKKRLEASMKKRNHIK
jgi:hypothetical protein